MKIIIGTESFLPNLSGVSIASRNLAENLTKAGHKVVILCPGDKHGTFVDPKFREYKVYRVRSIVNPFRKGYRITSASRAEIQEVVETVKPDLIHIQDVATIGLSLRNIGNEFNIPIIVTNHFSLEFALSYIKVKPLIPISRLSLIRYLVRFYNRCTLVTTPTETIAKQIRSWGVKTQVIAVSNGVDYKKFAKPLSVEKIIGFKLRYNLPNKPIVLYAGRIDKDKSVDVIIRAIPKVIKKVDAHFVFAGGGDMIEVMKNLANNLGVIDRVHFIGKIDNQTSDYQALFQASNVFAIASLIETQSLVTLEAMSTGLPIVAVNFNALPELVKNHENGYLFPPNSDKSLAYGLIRVLTNRAMSRKMGKVSQIIASTHEIGKKFKEILAIYQKLTDD